MVSSCSIMGCANKRVNLSTTNKRLRFYRFPKADKERMSKWTKATGRQNWEPRHFSRICSDHFILGEKSDNKQSPNYVPCIFSHTSMAERRRLQKLYDVYSLQVAERIEKINAATVMLSVVEQDLAENWGSDQPENGAISDAEVDDKLGKLYVDPIIVDPKKEYCSVEYTMEMEELLLKYSKNMNRKVVSHVDRSTQTAIVHDYIKSLEEECTNLRSELVYYKGKFVFKDIKIELLRDADDKVKYLTGLDSYDMLKMLNDAVSCYQKMMFKLSGFQQLLMTLMKMKLNLSNSFLGIMFNIDSATVSELFIYIIDLLFSKLVPLLIFWPSNDEMRKVLPPEFEDCDNCLYVVDCFELQLPVTSDTPVGKRVGNDNSEVHTLGKLQNVKYFLAIAPQGSIIFLSKGKTGEVGYKAIALESGFFENVSPGDMIVVERDLDIDDEVDVRGATLKMSSSVKYRILSENEESSRGLVRLKWATHLMKQKYQILESKMPLKWLKDAEKKSFTTLDKIVQVSCALFNMTNKVWTCEKFLVPGREKIVVNTD